MTPIEAFSALQRTLGAPHAYASPTIVQSKAASFKRRRVPTTTMSTERATSKHPRVTNDSSARIRASSDPRSPRLAEPFVMPADLLELIPEKYRGAASIGNSADAVAAWRAARAKNWPTNAIINEKRGRKEELV
jgi:hypothetical protein